MAVNKNAQLRYNIIDKCLSNFQRKHTYDTILDEVNDILSEHGYDGIKERQLKDDIKFMESLNGFDIELEEGLKDGKKKVLRYSNRHFSISEHPLNQLDKEQLNATLTILSRYKYRAEFAWLKELIPRMEQAFDLVDKGENGIISYQENIELKGLDLLGQLFNYIANKQTAKISYQAYGKEAEQKIIHPYHLKQYNNRWFLFCKTDGYESLSNYALDRINSIDEAEIKYIETDIEWTDYFYDVIGVSFPENTNPIIIKLKFSASRINYIKTKPIHHSQKTDKADTSGQTISIKVIPNPELFQTLLSFGVDMEVISPTEIRNQMAKICNCMDKIYQHAD